MSASDCVLCLIASSTEAMPSELFHYDTSVSFKTSLLKSLSLDYHLSASLSQQTGQREKIRVCEIGSMRASRLPVTLIPGNARLVGRALCEQKRDGYYLVSLNPRKKSFF